MTQLELACFTPESALLAAKEKVDRIELCVDYVQGGLTPDIETLALLKREFNVPVFIMLRPHSRGFVYTDEEFNLMKSDLIRFKEAGADGFVFGILTETSTVNLIQNRELVTLAGGLPCTFHRAFDEIDDKETALEELIDCGFKTVLTSGGKRTAMQGLTTLLALKEQAKNRIQILAGGGIRSGQISTLKKHFDFIHTACTRPNSEEIDSEELRAIQQILKNPV